MLRYASVMLIMLYLRSANAEHQSTSGLLNMSQCVKLSETSLKLGDDEATKFLLSFYTGLRELSIFKNSVSFIKLFVFLVPKYTSRK